MEAFDPSTGQIYLETTAPVRSMVSNWANKSTGNRENPSTYKNSGIGSSSLYSMALRTCVWNLELFMPETLEYGTWHYSGRIYAHLKRIDAVTLKTWTTFRTIFPDEGDPTYPVRVPETRGSFPREIGSISSRLSTLHFDCLTSLCIRNLLLNKDSFMALLDIPNLSVLALEQEEERIGSRAYGYKPWSMTGVDDRFMQIWARAIHEKGTFKKLRVLLLRHFSIGLESLPAFTIIPELYLVNMGSRYLKEKLEGSTIGQIFNSGDWRHLPENPDAEDANKRHPETTWQSKRITTHRKMGILHDFAMKSLAQSATTGSEESCISIVYGNPSSPYGESHSAWFTRIIPSERAQAEKSTKRTAIGNDGSKANSGDKKRKAREGKQKDLGSMLGAFGA